jgi:hypothetical protein
MLINDELKMKIEQIIGDIASEYRRTKGLILSEDDLKCLIFSKLKYYFYPFSPSYNRRRQNNLENTPQQQLTWRMKTSDESIYASPMHTEVPWYDRRNKLAIRPDITLLEPNKLSILHGLGGFHLPSKQFEFGGQGVIFELKFIRNKYGINEKHLKSFQKDFDKIKAIFDRLASEGKSNDIYCYFIIFNKTNLYCNQFRRYLQAKGTGPWYKIIYGTGNVIFD